MKRLIQKRLWTMAILPMLLLLISDVHAVYLIELKNGNMVVTSRWWEDNGLIKYYQMDGIVGINKEFVLTIQTDSTIDRTMVTEPAPTVTVPEVTQLSEDNAKLNKMSEDSKEFKEKTAKFQEDLQRNHRESAVFVEQYRQAKEQGDKQTMAEAWKKLEELQTEQARLYQELKKVLDGELPEWWETVLSH